MISMVPIPKYFIQVLHTVFWLYNKLRCSLAVPLLKKIPFISQSVPGDCMKPWPLSAGSMSGISDLHLVIRLVSNALWSTYLS